MVSWTKKGPSTWNGRPVGMEVSKPTNNRPLGTCIALPPPPPLLLLPLPLAMPLLPLLPSSVLERRAATESMGQRSSDLKGSEVAMSRISAVGATTLATTHTSRHRTIAPDERRDVEADEVEDEDEDESEEDGTSSPSPASSPSRAEPTTTADATSGAPSDDEDDEEDEEDDCTATAVALSPEPPSCVSLLPLPSDEEEDSGIATGRSSRKDTSSSST